MIKIISFVIFLLFVGQVFGQQVKCGFDAGKNIRERHYVDSLIFEGTNRILLNRDIIVIPVVFHVVWHETDENIEDEIIVSQLNTINADFSGANNDIEKVPAEFSTTVGRAEIKFCLASTDPFGNPTSGTTRTHTDKNEIGLTKDIYYSSSGGYDAWDPDKYLNIWIANTGSFLSGISSYPGEPIKEESGIIINPKFAGINKSKKYGLGRVLTHELGHFLGLKHLWGDDNNCETDDDIEDTPLQRGPYINCPSYPQSGCSESEMFMNFMDYVDDPCMYFFTKGQVQRILTAIMLFRQSLINGNTQCEIKNQLGAKLLFYPNPSSDVFMADIASKSDILLRYEVFNISGFRIKYGTEIVNRRFNLDLSDFPSGVYFVRIESEVYRLVKM